MVNTSNCFAGCGLLHLMSFTITNVERGLSISIAARDLMHLSSIGTSSHSPRMRSLSSARPAAFQKATHQTALCFE